MAILNYHSITITRPQIFASSSSLQNDSPSSPSFPRHSHLKSSDKLPKGNYEKLQEKLSKQKPNHHQPSILEIERAIGAGVFRDRDVDRQGAQLKSLEEQASNSLFDNVMKNSVGKDEGSMEKKLRETGEWLLDQTEKTSRTAGKQILLTLVLWVLPMWMFAFLVAAGIIDLPFNVPFIEDIVS